MPNTYMQKSGYERSAASAAVKQWGLKPCPACGYQRLNARTVEFTERIVCDVCGLIGPSGGNLQTAVALWNDRFQPGENSPEKAQEPTPLDRAWEDIRQTIDHLAIEGIAIEDSEAGAALFALQGCNYFQTAVLSGAITQENLKHSLLYLISASVLAYTSRQIE